MATFEVKDAAFTLPHVLQTSLGLPHPKVDPKQEKCWKTSDDSIRLFVNVRMVLHPLIPDGRSGPDADNYTLEAEQEGAQLFQADPLAIPPHPLYSHCHNSSLELLGKPNEVKTSTESKAAGYDAESNSDGSGALGDTDRAESSESYEPSLIDGIIHVASSSSTTRPTTSQSCPLWHQQQDVGSPSRQKHQPLAYLDDYPPLATTSSNALFTASYPLKLTFPYILDQIYFVINHFQFDKNVNDTTNASTLATPSPSPSPPSLLSLVSSVSPPSCSSPSSSITINQVLFHRLCLLIARTISSSLNTVGYSSNPNTTIETNITLAQYGESDDIMDNSGSGNIPIHINNSSLSKEWKVLAKDTVVLNGYTPSREHNAWGAVDILYEEETSGLYLLNIAPRKRIPWHTHSLMDEAEMVLSTNITACESWACVHNEASTGTGNHNNNTNNNKGEDSIITVSDSVSPSRSSPIPPIVRGSLPFAVHQWGSTPHTYCNTSLTQWARVLCIDRPKFIPHDETYVVDKDITNTMKWRFEHMRGCAKQSPGMELFISNSNKLMKENGKNDSLHHSDGPNTPSEQINGMDNSNTTNRSTESNTTSSSSPPSSPPPSSSSSSNPPLLDILSSSGLTHPSDLFWLQYHVNHRQPSSSNTTTEYQALHPTRHHVPLPPLQLVFPGGLPTQSVTLTLNSSHTQKSTLTHSDMTSDTFTNSDNHHSGESEKPPSNKDLHAVLCFALHTINIDGYYSKKPLVNDRCQGTDRNGEHGGGGEAVKPVEKGGHGYKVKGLALVKHKKRGWEVPGGKVDPGECGEGAALRELREEGGDRLAYAYSGMIEANRSHNSGCRDDGNNNVNEMRSSPREGGSDKVVNRCDPSLRVSELGRYVIEERDQAPHVKGVFIVEEDPVCSRVEIKKDCVQERETCNLMHKIEGGNVKSSEDHDVNCSILVNETDKAGLHPLLWLNASLCQPQRSLSLSLPPQESTSLVSSRLPSEGSRMVSETSPLVQDAVFSTVVRILQARERMSRPET